MAYRYEKSTRPRAPQRSLQKQELSIAARGWRSAAGKSQVEVQPPEAALVELPDAPLEVAAAFVAVAAELALMSDPAPATGRLGSVTSM
jgi:hypothetical protein